MLRERANVCRPFSVLLTFLGLVFTYSWWKKHAPKAEKVVKKSGMINLVIKTMCSFPKFSISI